MSEHKTHLSELDKLYPSYRPVSEPVEKCTWLSIEYLDLKTFPPVLCRLSHLVCLLIPENKLSSIPESISVFTGLRDLDLHGNSLSSLPRQISSLTGLSYMGVYRNPMSQLPLEITNLYNLRLLYISYRDQVEIRRAPRGISLLPCWNEGNDDYTFIRALRLYDEPSQLTSPSSFVENTANLNISTDERSEPIAGEYSDVMNAGGKNVSLIGVGSFSTAYKVHLREDVVVVKVIKMKARPNTPEYNTLTREAKSMVNLHHPNIISLYACGCKNQNIYFVVEYADEQSVWYTIQTFGAFSLVDCVKYTTQIIRGLGYLHNQNPPVVHGNLKPENVLLRKGVAKVSNFGTQCAREAVAQATGLQSYNHYMAPETLEHNIKTTSSDMYAFAHVVWAMVTGRRPYEELRHEEITIRKLRGKAPNIPESCHPKVSQLLCDCWVLEPTSRPSAAAIKARLVAFWASGDKLQARQIL